MTVGHRIFAGLADPRTWPSPDAALSQLPLSSSSPHAPSSPYPPQTASHRHGVSGGGQGGGG